MPPVGEREPQHANAAHLEKLAARDAVAYPLAGSADVQHENPSSIRGGLLHLTLLP